ncbi:MAG: hypothetical protein ICV81_20385 [Flavisolibacter sp.]|nr:hypothetical protein [Flavisolibacter sp.]
MVTPWIKRLEQTTRLTGKAPQTATLDRGYKGRTQLGDTLIQIPKPFNAKTTSTYKQQKLKGNFRRRAAIEPVISHLKTDHRLIGNFYKGRFADNINGMLSAAAFHFKRMINKWKAAFLTFLQNLIFAINLMLSQLNFNTKRAKLSF